MKHFIDFSLVIVIVAIALIFLYRSLRKSGDGCASGCSSCKSSCNNSIKQFKSIPIKTQGQ